ncbi:hypothetical protein [Bradyrhizobium sp. STM 3557]|uniref:hypothetical protein n=1 Tax=Bradyrhizobium sp. STM 3557 TaxID=578920 RepID=UPI00389071A1
MAKVEVSIDGGRNWRATQLGKDEGKYSFRQWQTDLSLPDPGRYSVAVRCTNSSGIEQPMKPNWNPAGFMRNVVETFDLEVA